MMLSANHGKDGETLLSESDEETNGGMADNPLSADRVRSPFTATIEVADGNASKEQWRYQQAAIYVREGTDHSKFAYHPQTPDAVAAYLAVNSVWLNVIDIVAAIVLMILAFFEDPPICDSCTNVTATAVVEILCLLAAHVHTLFYFRWKGKMIFKEKKTLLKLVLTVEMLIEAIVVLARQQQHLRFMRAFRPIFIIDNKFATGIKRVFYEMIQSLPPVLEILVLLMTFITTYAVMGYYLFGTQAVDQYTQDAHNWYFYSFQDSWVNLFILLTTANYPDVMMPAYRDNRWAALFFISYLMFALYFLANVLLAAVYSNFNSKEKEKFGRLYIHRRQGLRKAFQVLDDQHTGKMDFISFRGVLLHYSPRKTQHEIVCMFKCMDQENTGTISLEKWFAFYEVDLYSWNIDRRSKSGLFCAIQDYPPSISPFFQVLNRIVNLKIFEYFIDLCIVINAAFLIAEASLTDDENKEVHAIADYEQVFVSIYTVEAIMKICGLGLRGYFSKGFNVFDFIIVAVSLLGQIINRKTIYVTILRPFRLFRLFKLRKSFNNILAAMFNIIPRLTRFVMTLICVFYFFSIIGMTAFKGDISTCGCVHFKGQYQCNPELLQSTLPPLVYTNYTAGRNNTDNVAICSKTPGCVFKQCGGHYDGYYTRSYADGLYYLNNFDDIVSSYVVLFELMVVNNWHVTMQGAVSATESKTTATRVFFIMFFLVTVLMVTNVVVAFILDAFQSLLPTFEAKEEREQARKKREEEGVMEDDPNDDQDDLQTIVSMPVRILENLDDPKFVAKLRKKTPNAVEVKIKGSRRIQPIDIYLLIFGSDIDEWKKTENEQSEKEPRAHGRAYSLGFPKRSVATFTDGQPVFDVLEMGERAQSVETATPPAAAATAATAATASPYTAPEYVPATLPKETSSSDA